jgi:hypothetical protein
MREELKAEPDVDKYYIYPSERVKITFYRHPTLKEMIVQLADVLEARPHQVSLLVKCPWMPDREMYLPEALEEYYPNMQPTAVVISRGYGICPNGVVIPTNFIKHTLIPATESERECNVQEEVAKEEEEGDEWETEDEDEEEEWEDEELTGELEDEERLVV